VAQACNPSYLGGRVQENHTLKPAQTNSSRDPISKEKKKILHKKRLLESLKVRHRVQTPVLQKKKKRLSRKLSIKI
jgi:hypothetical protein